MSTEIVKFDNASDVVKALEKKIKEIKHIEETPWKTGTVALDGFGDVKNERLVANLIRAMHSVNAREEGYIKAAEDTEKGFGLSSYPAFEINGFSANDWRHDLRLRKEIVEQKETLDKLKSFKDRASAFISEQEKKDALFSEMKEFLGA